MTISLVGFDRVELAKKSCNRCGSTTVAWKESNAGKWYLIEAFDFDGELCANYKDFHSGYCDKPELHAVKQRQISEALGIVEEEKATLSVVEEERRAAEDSEFFLALHDLCKSDPHNAKMEIFARREILSRPVAEQRRTRIQAEIDFMRAALGMTVAE